MEQLNINSLIQTVCLRTDVENQLPSKNPAPALGLGILSDTFEEDTISTSNGYAHSGIQTYLDTEWLPPRYFFPKCCSNSKMNWENQG